MTKQNFHTNYPDNNGFFGQYGGQFIPPQLKPAMDEVLKAYEDAKKHYADLKQKEATYASELAVVSLFKEAPVDQPPSVKKDIPVVPAPAPEATPESSSDGVLEETHAY